MHFLSLPSLPRSQGPVSRPLFRRFRTFSSSCTLSTFQSASCFLLQRSARRRSSIPPPSLVHPFRSSVVFGALHPHEISIRIDISFPIPSRPPPRPFATGFHRGTSQQGIVGDTRGAAGAVRGQRGPRGCPRRRILEEYSFGRKEVGRRMRPMRMPHPSACGYERRGGGGRRRGPDGS